MRVFVVDDHAGFRAAVRTLLESAGFEIVGEADSVTTGLAAIRDLQPELALVDVNLPDGNGFDLIERIVAAAPTTKCVLISSRSPAEYRSRLEASPALGFISKAELDPEHLWSLVTATDDDGER